jgi:uncharacterized protein YcfJ
MTTDRTFVTPVETNDDLVDVVPTTPVSTKQTLEKGAPHGDEEVGGALTGGLGGAVIGAVVGGPVGAVIGGAIGAASGSTVGALDSKRKDETVVVTREEKTW